MLTATTPVTTVLQPSVRLSTLRPGTRFALPSLGLSGVLHSVTPCAATVEYDATTTRRIETHDGRVVEFAAPSRRLTVYRDVLVVPEPQRKGRGR